MFADFFEDNELKLPKLENDAEISKEFCNYTNELSVQYNKNQETDMRRKFFHRTTSQKEPGDYISAEILKFTLNYVKNTGELTSEAVLDKLLCFLEKAQVLTIIDRCLKLSKGEEYESPMDNASLKHLYSETIDYLTNGLSSPVKKDIIEEIVCSAQKKLANYRRSSGIKKDFFALRLKELQQLLNISDEAIEVFKVLYFAKNNQNFEDMCSGSSITLNGRYSPRTVILNLKLFTGHSEHVIKKAISKESPLRKYGLLEDDFDVVHQISEFLTGLNSEPLTNRFFRKYEGPSVGIEAHTAISKHLEIIEKIICNREDNGSINILLYGMPGTGKTECCRSLARHLGRDIYSINTYENDERPSSGARFRFTALKACQNSVQLDKSIMMIDEADEMLNGGSTAAVSSMFFAHSRNTDKDVLNDYLDNSPGVYFWITNHSQSIEESTRRRFDYSIEFKNFSKKERIKLWQSCIKKHQLEAVFSEDEIAGFAKKYDINAGGIDVALKNYKRLVKNDATHEKNNNSAKIIDTILIPHINLMTGNKVKREQPQPVPFYSLEGLNIKGEISIAESLDIMKHFSEHLNYDTDNAQKEQIDNMNLLMYGPPGTGKTEFAKFAAQEIGRPLMCKRGSDLLSMWVGGTEHNIREAFREAEADGAILFIDEADGLIADRGNAQRTWEVTQVNELLSNMEEFKGILICATNFKKNLDAASIRRFNLKIEFDYLDNQGKQLFFKRVLGNFNGNGLDTTEIATLNAIDNLAPGDFKVVRQKYSFMPKEKIANAALIGSLQIEAASKNGVKTNNIGF
jgi:transitional endoplasmic reticulum ATPase